MALSSDLTSQFAKLVTSDKTSKNSKRESTVYGTVVEYNGSKYVRIDGSGAMTPVVTTADVVVGERVTVMIKDHSATITGNITSPSARVGDVSDLSGRVDKIDVGVFQELQAENVEITKTLKAQSADITELKSTTLTAETAKVTYANIDFSNIGKAAMEYFYAQSGLIKDVTIGDTTITGQLIGVTISGDLIEGNTVVAEKLVIKGEDGLYYKLNTDGMVVEAEQTDYNSINGQVIKAQSITASKIAVDDLVAFDATIGGFNITSSSIYSGTKETVDNTTRGIYLDNDGQVAFGDESNYLKYYKDTDDSYKLEISAESIVFKSGSTAEETFESAMTSIDEEFYQSTSPNELTGGSWSESLPTWTEGIYIWRRTKITYGSGFSDYTPSETGVCIAGNTGETGKGVESTAVSYQASTDGVEVPTGEWSATIPSVDSGSYLWTRVVTTYTDDTSVTSYSVGMMGATGSPGTPGTDGKGISSTSIMYQASVSGTTVPTGTWSATVPDADPGQYIWTRTVITYTDSTKSTSYSIGMCGRTGDKGDKGDGLDVKDTQDDNQSPSWYITTYPKMTVMELKNCSTIGLSGEGTYCTLQTIIPSDDSSDGYPKQTAKVEDTGKEYWRVGTSDTEWSEWIDPYGQALESGKTATNYMAFNDVDEGLVIGDMTASTLGKNVCIDSDSVDIRNGSDVLASFAEDHVVLGQNAEESYIDLCDGAGKISANTAEAATSYPNRNAILIESQEIETDSIRFEATASNYYGLDTKPELTKRAEVYLLRDTNDAGTAARLKGEHWNTTTGRYINAGFVSMTYDDSDKTYASMFVNDNFNSVYNQIKMYRSKTMITKPVYIDGVEFSGSNKVLWTSTGLYMSESQSATLAEAISAQANGIVLVWSEYSDGASVNANFNMFYIPKQFVSSFSGRGISMIMSSATFNVVASKYVYITDTTITGYSNNNASAATKNSGVTTTPSKFVLRQVIGV